MKKLLLLLSLGAVNLSHAQDANTQFSVQDKNHKVMGHVRAGVITDANNTVICQFKSADGGLAAITDKNQKVLGYLKNGSEFEDGNHRKIGEIKKDGQSIAVLDGKGRKLGSIEFGTGAVRDAKGDIVGYSVDAEAMWSAPYFFLYKF